MPIIPRSSASTSRKPVPTSNTPAAPLSAQLPPPPPPPPAEEPMPMATPMSGGLKKSKSVRAKKALKTIANPIKTRREEKAKRSEVETAERKENEKNVQDFLATGRFVFVLYAFYGEGGEGGIIARGTSRSAAPTAAAAAKKRLGTIHEVTDEDE
ncbi:uncharacterized protein H6S33_010375 [Morchella sextelata]|uniref:uncharacterized protein n=1 Tax=Morchella sextelata TaxID=1174677 RepID=UPI001D04A496|nr:uncharacterized protein H6S33_010375 [Morchella sextelata]KAH0612323.1 hypothetical protein H6S33_010375 [Morchella sextelata]